MTKLLTALLIAGLSATAKAEPVVYFCNTIKYSEVTKDEVSNIRSYPFKLFIDTESRRMKVAGELINFEATDNEMFAKVIPWHADYNLGENAFHGFALGKTFDFRSGVFAFSAISTLGGESMGKEMIVASYLAQCDKF